MPETANAQIWITSGFKAASDGVSEIAYCSTSAINPATGQASPAAADYEDFASACSVTPSTGAVIFSAECPSPSNSPYRNPSGSPAKGNPTGECDISFAPQPGVTYTVNSEHGIWFYLDPAGTQCGQYIPDGVCFSDPLGYYSANPFAADPWPIMPTYSSTQPLFTLDEPCSTMGNCTPQGIPVYYCAEKSTIFDLCQSGYVVFEVPFWFLAKTSAQWTYCPTPKPATTNALLPKTWFAGESYDITITGTGFNPTAFPGCPVTPVVAKAGSGSTVSLSNVVVVSPTQITATVTPGASDPTGNAAITVGSSTISGGFSIRTQILGNQVTCDPSLNCTQTVISTTDGSTPPTQNAVVGQQILLNTNTPATTTYDGPTLNPTWTVGGTRIKNYAPSTASASVTELAASDLQTNSATFYWVYPNNPTPVTFQYCVNIQGANPVLQCSLPANASFNVTGPSGVNVTPDGQEFFISDDQLEMIWGIQFNATATSPPGYTGEYTWVQLIQSLTQTAYLNDGTQYVCTAGPGLDTVYPYDSGLYAEDGPTEILDSTIENHAVDAIDFQMFFMWNPKTTDGSSIPVPLGSITWSTTSDVVWNSSTSTWTVNPDAITPSPDATTSAGFSTLSPSFPQWVPPVITPKTLNCN
jgi:hypothetical protein